MTPNLGWRNEGLPSRDGSGRTRLSNPPLALDLHYLLSAYSGGDLHAEILLGYAMQLLHEIPVLTREAIRTALQRPPDDRGRAATGTARPGRFGPAGPDRAVKITPEYLNTEEIPSSGPRRRPATGPPRPIRRRWC